MARRLRVEYAGAIYHVINRGNYRRNIFETATTAQAFEANLTEACERHGWRLHAYAIMRNHFHLALETPQPNLAEGMHWLQSTFATRFNRFRSEQGHLFQGRYRALLIEDFAVLARVVSYIHLNPVRAGIVPVKDVAAFRWSSLSRFMKTSRPSWLVAREWLDALGLTDTSHDWRLYVNDLITLASDTAEQEELGFHLMTRGWAIGANAWKNSVVKELPHLGVANAGNTEESREAKEKRWLTLFLDLMRDAGKTSVDIDRDAKGASWKVATAQRLRHEAGARCAWIAEMLKMGRASSVRVYLCKARIND